MSQVARQLISDNLFHLEQGRRLLRKISDEQYKAVPVGLHPHRVGGHIRHCLEFYECFAEGLPRGAVDYSSRRRSLDLEECRHSALRRFDDTRERLGALSLPPAGPPSLSVLGKGIRTGVLSWASDGDSNSAEGVSKCLTSSAAPHRGDLLVRSEGVYGEESQRGWVLSTLERELQFLASHTVHHYALIALTLRAQGVTVGTDFGMAPSTLRHSERERCAR